MSSKLMELILENLHAGSHGQARIPIIPTETNVKPLGGVYQALGFVKEAEKYK